MQCYLGLGTVADTFLDLVIYLHYVKCVSQLMVCFLAKCTTTATTTICPGLPGWADTRRMYHSVGCPQSDTCHLLSFIVQGEDNRGRHMTIWMDAIPSGLSVPPSLSSPPFLCLMPFLPQPSQFILAWDRHQVCRLAYPVDCFLLNVIAVTFSKKPIHNCLQNYTHENQNREVRK